MNATTKRICCSLVALVLAAALVWSFLRPTTGVNALSWNVRKAIAEGLEKDAGALTTNDLAGVTSLDLSDYTKPWLTLPSAQAVFQQFIPDRKTKITDDDLRNVEHLTPLKRLFVRSTRVTDAGLVHLEKLATLQRLTLLTTQVTDAGLVHLEKLPALQVLDLYAMHVTDSGLVHLEKLSELKHLRLRDTQVTDAGVERLKQKLPKCEIEW